MLNVPPGGLKTITVVVSILVLTTIIRLRG